MRVPGLRSINAGGSLAPHAPGRDQRRPPHSRVLGQVTRCESTRKVAWAQAPMQVPAQQRCSVLPQPSQAEASPAVALPPSRRRSYTLIATGTPGSRLLRSLAQPVQSTHLEQVSPRRCGASPQHYDEPVSQSHCRQPGSSRSQGHRRPDPAFCLHGEKRTLTTIVPGGTEEDPLMLYRTVVAVDEGVAGIVIVELAP